METTSLFDADGTRYWHVSHNGYDKLWASISDAQKVAVRLMEKWGWTFVRVDRDSKLAYVWKEGEIMTTIRRD